MSLKSEIEKIKDEDSSPFSKKTHLRNNRYADDIDPTLKFLYEPRSICTMIILVILLILLAFNNKFISENADNVKIGFLISSLIFTFIGVLQFQDGPFIRPHPAFWRAILAISILYLLLLIFLLFQVFMLLLNFILALIIFSLILEC